MVRTLQVSTLAAAATVAFLTACSSNNSGGSNASCKEGGGADGGACITSQTSPYKSCADLTTPTVSFSKEVVPVFNFSCSFADCHAMQTNPAMSYLVYLGSRDGGVDASQVISGLVGQPAAADPKMNYVTAGDPEHSFLMHKLDDDQCAFAADCNAGNNPTFQDCGGSMPLESPLLDTDTRDKIRRWIAQGAKNN